jgi:hypothetical protein
MKHDIPDPTGGWADGRSPYLWDKELDGVLRVVSGVARPNLRRPAVRRAAIGLIFVVFVFVVAPIVAMFAASQ